MVSSSDFIFNKSLLKIIGINTPEDYSKKSNHFLPLMDSPLSILSFKKLIQSYGSVNAINEVVENLIADNVLLKDEDKILYVWLKLYNFRNEEFYFKMLHDNKNDLIVGSHFADIVNYMFLTERTHIEQIKSSEWLVNNNFIDITRIRHPANIFQDEDFFIKTLNIMSTNYSFSETVNIMFMNYESKYKLFVEEESSSDSLLTSREINNATYQMLIIYYYSILKQVKLADINDSLRLKEFMDYSKRQAFYYNIYKLSLHGNPDLYHGLPNVAVEDMNDFIDLHIVNRISLLVNSIIPVEEWYKYIYLPYEWLSNLVGKR